jgi:hypothetical protein
MIIKYKYGFEFKGFLYGWKDKKLFRLPIEKGKRFYSLKEVKEIKVGNKKGYNVGRVKKTIDQLKEITIFINYKHQQIKDSECPF